MQSWFNSTIKAGKRRFKAQWDRKLQAVEFHTTETIKESFIFYRNQDMGLGASIIKIFDIELIKLKQTGVFYEKDCFKEDFGFICRFIVYLREYACLLTG